LSKFTNPFIFINFKAYKEVEGAGALEIAKACEEVADSNGVSIIVCPPVVELSHVSKNVDIPVFAQSVSPKASGACTGWVTPSMVKVTGAMGTLISHSENKYELETVMECVDLTRSEGLKSVVCVENLSSAIEYSSFNPDFIAIEPPELIGGDISVTTANPKIVSNTVEGVKRINKDIFVLCGAGVKTGEDVREAMSLGAEGVLLASGVVKSKDPKGALLDLIKYV